MTDRLLQSRFTHRITGDFRIRAAFADRDRKEASRLLTRRRIGEPSRLPLEADAAGRNAEPIHVTQTSPLKDQVDPPSIVEQLNPSWSCPGVGRHPVEGSDSIDVGVEA